jgi:drug/metabolite transporter (DMT)-like permease
MAGSNRFVLHQKSPEVISQTDKRTHALLVVACFLALYLIWGSTYLAIRWALSSFPPFLMAGIRFVFAGGIMYAWLMLRGQQEQLTFKHWRSAAIIGGLLLVCGNGGVVWAAQTIPSGLVSLFVSVMPIWVVLLDWLRPGGKAPSLPVIAGLIVGFAGVTLLISNGELPNGGIDWLGTGLLILSPLAWSAGSLFSRQASLPKSPLLATAMEMLCGGAFMLVIALCCGEFTRFQPAHVTLPALLSLLYLAVFGSIIGFSSYIWLLKVVSPARVATYAYVNPLVAVFLGWSLAGEPVGPRTILAASVILASVALITNHQSHSKDPVEQEELIEELPGPAAGPVVCSIHTEDKTPPQEFTDRQHRVNAEHAVQHVSQ